MLKNETVGLRAIEESDLPQLMDWRNKPELRKYFRGYDEINTTNQYQWFKSVTASDSKHKMFAIVKLDTNTLLGACGLCYIDSINHSADFSIYIGYNDLYIDDIYAIHAANLMIDYGFKVLNLHRLWAEIYSFDEKKKIFFNTLNFNLDGTLRETYRYDMKWYDSLFYSLLVTDKS